MNSRDKLAEYLNVSSPKHPTHSFVQNAIGGKETPIRPRCYEWAKGQPSVEEKTEMHTSILDWFSQLTEAIPPGTSNKAICRLVARHHADRDPRWYLFPDELQFKENPYWLFIKNRVAYCIKH